MKKSGFHKMSKKKRAMYKIDFYGWYYFYVVKCKKLKNESFLCREVKKEYISFFTFFTFLIAGHNIYKKFTCLIKFVDCQHDCFFPSFLNDQYFFADAIFLPFSSFLQKKGI